MNLLSVFGWLRGHTLQERQLALALLKIAAGERSAGLYDLLAAVRGMLPEGEGQGHVDTIIADLKRVGF